ncbi:hypothetical protein [Ochrobactrum quorumnocens]|uniref:Uncharacterized protein n=1 Tax=Ochrobactrum quorumnocens TaxID=271865 RepID=A0A5N1JV54_9HYPH|nr:hypothetical protein [[Ochrobactrum] quorumnocens]KAA9367079.1 hypothetical protein F3W84_14815 [[Ochrobactrum] quorumnocens]
MLQQLNCDKDGATPRDLALAIFTTYPNGHPEKAWPFYQMIAEATGMSVTTIQPVARDGEIRAWFQVQRKMASGTIAGGPVTLKELSDGKHQLLHREGLRMLLLGPNSLILLDALAQIPQQIRTADLSILRF